MLKTFRSKTKAGFTLVEIMIVVAIIALLASIAVPNFLRARQRSQATRILEDARILDAAKDQWAIETNQAGTVNASDNWEAIKGFLKAGSPMAQGGASAPVDLLGTAYTATTVDEPIKVASTTVANYSSLFEEAAEGGLDPEHQFWGAHHPDTGGTTGDDD